MLARSCSALSNMAAVIFVPSVNSPCCDIHTASSRGPAQFIALRMLHAVMREASDIERIGEIIEMGQFVGNLEFSGVFGHLKHQ